MVKFAKDGAFARSRTGHGRLTSLVASPATTIGRARTLVPVPVHETLHQRRGRGVGRRIVRDSILSVLRRSRGGSDGIGPGSGPAAGSFLRGRRRARRRSGPARRRRARFGFLEHHGDGSGSGSARRAGFVRASLRRRRRPASASASASADASSTTFATPHGSDAAGASAVASASAAAAAGGASRGANRRRPLELFSRSRGYEIGRVGIHRRANLVFTSSRFVLHAHARSLGNRTEVRAEPGEELIRELERGLGVPRPRVSRGVSGQLERLERLEFTNGAVVVSKSDDDASNADGEGLRPPLEELIALETRHLRGGLHDSRRLEFDVAAQSFRLSVPAIHLAAEDEAMAAHARADHRAVGVHTVYGFVVRAARARFLEGEAPVAHERVAALAIGLAGEILGGFEDVQDNHAVDQLRLHVPRVAGVPGGGEDFAEVPAPGDDVRGGEDALVHASLAERLEDGLEVRGPGVVPVAVAKRVEALGQVEGHGRPEVTLELRLVVRVPLGARFREGRELHGLLRRGRGGNGRRRRVRGERPTVDADVRGLLKEGRIVVTRVEGAKRTLYGAGRGTPSAGSSLTRREVSQRSPILDARRGLAVPQTTTRGQVGQRRTNCRPASARSQNLHFTHCGAVPTCRVDDYGIWPSVRLRHATTPDARHRRYVSLRPSEERGWGARVPRRFSSPRASPRPIIDR